jgi:DNA packaging protein, QLRG family|nr:MAG TPA: Head Tail Connector Protein [Caudoviricetes sp.]
MYVNLAQIKKHLNIDTSFHDDDEYLVDLGQVAEKAVERHIDDNLENIYIASGGEQLPAPLVHSILLLLGNLYANRESIAYTSLTEIPYNLTYLLDLYKNYSKRYTGGDDKLK